MQSLIVLFVTFYLVSDGIAVYLRNDTWRDDYSINQDSIRKAPNNIRPKISLASICMSKKSRQCYDLDKAKELLIEAERLYKKNKKMFQKDWIGGLYHNAGALYHKKDDFDKAIRYYYAALQFNSANWKTYAQIAYLSFKMDDFQTSESALQYAIQLNSAVDELYNMLGVTYYHLGEIDKAIANFRKIKNTKIANIARLNLVACLLHDGNTPEARRQFTDIPSADNNIHYLLFKLRLSSEEKRRKLFEKIAQIALVSDLEFTAWLEKIEQNTNPGMIYPDISDLKSMMIDQYNRKVEEYIEHQNEKVEAVQLCIDS